MKKFFIEFLLGLLAISILFIFIAFWSGSSFVSQINKKEIKNFENHPWNSICSREKGKIDCKGVFDEKLKKIEKTIKNNRDGGVKVISVSAHLTGWTDIYCDYFRIIAIDFFWPFRW